MLLSPSSRKHDLPLLMGIVNVTGDSFSEGGLSAPETAVERALQLLADGADILDIGGESTRPGAEDVTGKVEISRLSPVISEILRQAPDAVISVDTRRAGTAGEMLGLGAKIINDVSMLRFDPEMPEVLRENPESILVLCHSRGTPQNMRFPEFCRYDGDVVEIVCNELLEAAEKSGVSRERIWFDPGFGFAKTVEQQIVMMQGTARMVKRLGNVLAGISRKSFIGEITGEKDPALRTGGTLAGELHLASCGAAVIRTHNVRMLRDALKMKYTVEHKTEETEL